MNKKKSVSGSRGSKDHTSRVDWDDEMYPHLSDKRYYAMSDNPIPYGLPRGIQYFPSKPDLENENTKKIIVH